VLYIQNNFELLKSKFPHLNRIDLGGGVGIDYESQNLNFENKLVHDFGAWVQEAFKDPKWGAVQLMTEPGRFLVAHCGVLICQVQYLKIRKDITFAVLDSGMNHLLRPALYEAKHSIYPMIKHSENKSIYTIVGPVCESSDVLGEDYSMFPLREGDLVAIADCGAYGATMQSDYNLFPKASEILIT
jgi:diaminopimelate decarboxylase